LLPSMTGLDNILLPAQIGNRKDLSAIRKKARELADHLQVSHCLTKYPHQMSGGEQQRINVIRALSLNPKMLLCDEPTGNLDSLNSHKVITLLKDLAGQFEATLAVVTHDAEVAAVFEQQFHMKDGQLVNEV
jgi:lipoprotein-releasing system ATP-binding protein